MNEGIVSNRSHRQWEADAQARVAKGESRARIEADMTQQGMEPGEAHSIVNRAVSNARSKAFRTLIGCMVLAAAGIFVTAATYSAASSNPQGGEYLIWYGPIVCGGIGTLVGFFRLANIG